MAIARIVCKSKQEAALIEKGMNDPEIRALAVLIAVLKPLSKPDRRKVLTKVEEHITINRAVPKAAARPRT